MGKKFDKFRLLMWKNWKLQYRNPLQTTVEILAPIFISILLVTLRSLVDPSDNPTHIYRPFRPIPFKEIIFKSSESNVTDFEKSFSLVYSPSPNKVLDRAMLLLKLFFKDVKGYKNSENLEAHFATNEANLTFAGIQLDNDLYGKSDLPPNVKVSLRFPAELRSMGGKNFLSARRSDKKFKKSKGAIMDKLSQVMFVHDWKTDLLYPMVEAPGPRSWEENEGGKPGYFSEGFLMLQVLVTLVLGVVQADKNFGKLLLTSRILSPESVKMQRFPHAAWKSDPLLPALITFIGMLTMLSFVYTCINLVKVITTEKEKQLKEAMKIMGLPNWLHWTAWFVKSFTFLLISVICIVFLLKIPWYSNSEFSIFTYGSATVILLLLVLYVCATITFSFAISVFFSKANTAAAVAGLMWFLSYTPYMFLQIHYDELSLSTKLLASLGSNTAVAFGLQIALMFEGTTEGIQWSNIWRPSAPEDTLTLGMIMVMLIFDTFIYLLVALYVEAVFPGEFGTPRPWYFPFTCRFWCGYPRYLVVEDFEEEVKKNEFFEDDPHLKVGIKIINLTKQFKKKVAVKNISVKMYQDQITVLLGHNGAGKTTTMSMLCGIIPPSDGTATMLGYDIRTNMKEIRANLGLCPQHNILFDDLTVKEHLYFFGKLKGVGKKEIGEEITKYVQLLGLEEKMNKKSKTLSGGMKRKLCAGIALCGDSKIVLFDEPTAGIDPSSRRHLWDLLQQQKHGRCILLTTHYMDEADLLGDRTAIMAAGEIKCCGTNFFLKKKFGTGYRLILDTQPNCDPNQITQFLQSYIAGIRIHAVAGSEVTYLLGEDKTPVFKSMFENLESNGENLGIRSFGISLTTMEEVFLKVGSDPREENVVKLSEKSHTVTVPMKLSSRKLLTGADLILNQFMSMLMKRLLSTLRSWLLLLVQILIPVILLIIAIVASRIIARGRIGDLPKLDISLDSYKNSVTLIEDDGFTSYGQRYFESIKGHTVLKVSSINETMIELTKKQPKTTRKDYLVGASFTHDGSFPVVIAWFNNNPFHTPPLALGLILNVLYQELLGSEHSITFANHPLPFSSDAKVKQLLKGQSLGFQIGFNLGFSMAFVSSFYILFYVKERVCKSKHLQFTSGAKAYIFWITSYLCDLLTFMIVVVLLIVIFACFQEDGYRSLGDFARMTLLLFYFGFAMLPMMYLASYLFELPSTGYTRMTLFSIVTGVTAFLVVRILALPELELTNVAKVLHWIFLTIPHYSLATGVKDTYTTYALKGICNKFVDNCAIHHPNKSKQWCWNVTCQSNHSDLLSSFCCGDLEDYYKWEEPGIGRNLLFSFLSGAVLFLIVVIIEYEFFSSICRRLFQANKSKMPQRVKNEDDDVFREKEKIRNTPEAQLRKDHMLVLKDLTKYYGQFLAVNGLCLSVKQQECFGLLGINGAGKTTTFKMLTGDLRATYGDAWVNGYSIKTQLDNVHRTIGYCPQFDALLPELTARETLVIFGLLRGMPLNDAKIVADKLAKDFDFQQHLNKMVKQLSGGNRRKLSTAIALIGDPLFVSLDEPTAGMDPVSKRYLWNTLCTYRDKGKCILLTSHSMEECEAVCTRLAIMVNGNFKCLGSIQHLKNKFVAGYTLQIKLKREVRMENLQREIARIENFVSKNFPSAIQKEKHQELLSYYIVDRNIKWSQMFAMMETAKEQLHIENYSLGQSSLEQVFLKLAQHQR